MAPEVAAAIAKRARKNEKQLRDALRSAEGRTAARALVPEARARYIPLPSWHGVHGLYVRREDALVGCFRDVLQPAPERESPLPAPPGAVLAPIQGQPGLFRLVDEGTGLPVDHRIVNIRDFVGYFARVFHERVVSNGVVTWREAEA